MIILGLGAFLRFGGGGLSRGEGGCAGFSGGGFSTVTFFAAGLRLGREPSECDGLMDFVGQGGATA